MEGFGQEREIEHCLCTDPFIIIVSFIRIAQTIKEGVKQDKLIQQQKRQTEPAKSGWKKVQIQHDHMHSCL